jgi:Cu+-exporting ATPase
MKEIVSQVSLKCFHCGDQCNNTTVEANNKVFCCQGCKAVYEILNEKDMCSYYDFEKMPGNKINPAPKELFAYLDNEDIKNKILDFHDGNSCKVTLYIPAIHCTSCVWLLENLRKINKGIISSQINFMRKELSLSYNEDMVSLRKIVELVDSFGYTPQIKLDNIKGKKEQKSNSILYKIGVAGFCFGNIMILSFPEYFSLSSNLDESYKTFFGYLNLILSLPVFFYSASGYFTSAFAGMRNRIINIDFPIALGLTVVFSRSLYEVMSHTGLGFFDSLTGLIFFLLIGKWFQSKSYEALSFEKDFKSYFPLGITLLKGTRQESISIDKIKAGDRILVRNQEIFPGDGRLVKGEACIDYSFVTGESSPVIKNPGDTVYAGGRQTGNAIELEIIKDISHSYFTQLWNQEVFKKKNSIDLFSFANKIGKVFTIAVIILSAITYSFWQLVDKSNSLYAAISVLIIFCPCTLALAIPFAYGNTLRLFGKNGFYLKNTETIETLSKIDTIVFDKTGTMTKKEAVIEFEGSELSQKHLSMIKTLTSHSIHPLSLLIYRSIENNESSKVSDFKELIGKGISGSIDGHKIQVGSDKFIFGEKKGQTDTSSKVYISIDSKPLGCFVIKNNYREGILPLITELKKNYDVHLLSGDNNSEKKFLESCFKEENIHFAQSPLDKLNYIKGLQQKGKTVLMLGDGLNDAGALKQADAGITVAEDVFGFSPACDGILDADRIRNFKSYISFSKTSSGIVKSSLAVSLLYNFIGLGFAVSGKLTPLTAAIIMPLSSISIVLYVTLATKYFSWRKHL